MSKVRIIAARECKLALTAWPFWLVTLGLPLLMVTVGAITLFIGINTGKSFKGDKKDKIPPVLGIVDHAGLMDWESLNEVEPEEVETPPEIAEFFDSVNLPASLEQHLKKSLAPIAVRGRALDYKVFEASEEAIAALKNKKLRGVLEIHADYRETLRTDLTVLDDKTRLRMSMVENDLRTQALSQQLGKEQARRILKPLDGVEKKAIQEPASDQANEAGKGFNIFEEFKKFVLPIGFMMMFVFVIITSADRLMRGMAEEKTNRVIEVLLSSTTSDQLMAGKVLGLGLVGLIQMGIWLTLAFLPLSWILAFVDFPLVTFLVFMAFFLLGYFMFGSMVLGLGSLGKDLQEANQWMGIIVIFTVLPMSVIPTLIENPQGMLAQIFTWFPFTSPLVVVLRFGADAITVWYYC